MDRLIDAYARHKNLKLAANELGMKWQTLYSYLRRKNIPITGDKLRYGSDKDRLAARAELMFQRLVPNAVNMNVQKFQAKVDFTVGSERVDVKASMLKQGNKRFPSKRWAFSIKKQEMVADFIVCFGFMDGTDAYKVFLLPSEIIKYHSTVSIAPDGKSKWLQYEVEPQELLGFFNGFGESAA